MGFAQVGGDQSARNGKPRRFHQLGLYWTIFIDWRAEWSDGTAIFQSIQKMVRASAKRGTHGCSRVEKIGSRDCDAERRWRPYGGGSKAMITGLSFFSHLYSNLLFHTSLFVKLLAPGILVNNYMLFCQHH